MSVFWKELQACNSQTARETWLYVPYDQLNAQLGPLSREPKETLGVILVENLWKGRRRPYHKQKLALILANMRHFALELARSGVRVEYLAGDAPYSELLKPCIEKFGELSLMEPAERELREDLSSLTKLKVLPHEGWLTTENQFLASQRGLKSWRMDSFYRNVRKLTKILMEKGKPLGGKFSHDAENRKPWRGEPSLPELPTFGVDPIKREVGELIESEFAEHPGHLDLDSLPATREDAEKLWTWAKDSCMVHFGPYEDAMSSRHSSLFHTRLSPLLNIHRILPRKVLEDALELEIPLNSKEGFVRQILGWREFMRHVHRQTDGFRDTPGVLLAETPDRGASPNFFQASEPLPPTYWGKAPSGLNCLDSVLKEVWREGYSHHITRLMVLSNLATLLGVNPRELTDWFWVAYTDAFDWVVEPNVLGMGTYALGESFTTKPYISGAAYIDRMSDYCRGCRFHPKKNCPVTPLYWSFLQTHREKLQGNQRMSIMLRNLERRSEDKKSHDATVSQMAKRLLREGRTLTPESFGS